MTSFTSMDLKSLVGLLNLEEDVDTEVEDFGIEALQRDSNSHLKAQAMKESQLLTNDFCNNAVKNKTKNIWDDEEILDEEEDEAKLKEKPEYEILYQQTVTPDDVFLQLSGKDPGSNSCECLLIKIKLPGVHLKDEVNLNISALKLICKTKNYYLNLDLPREVDPVKCSAKWDGPGNLLVAKLFFDEEFKLKF